MRPCPLARAELQSISAGGCEWPTSDKWACFHVQDRFLDTEPAAGQPQAGDAYAAASTASASDSEPISVWDSKVQPCCCHAWTCVFSYRRWVACNPVALLELMMAFTWFATATLVPAMDHFVDGSSYRCHSMESVRRQPAGHRPRRLSHSTVVVAVPRGECPVAAV